MNDREKLPVLDYRYKPSRADQTPSIAACTALDALAEWFDNVLSEALPDRYSRGLVERYLRSLNQNPKDSDTLVRQQAAKMSAEATATDQVLFDTETQAAEFCIVYCYQAIEAEQAGRLPVAWSFVMDAMYWFGVFRAAEAAFLCRKPSVHEMARKGADARHRENRDLKAHALAFYEKNKDRFDTMTDAAEAIAGKEVPVKQRTVLTWLSAQKKSS
jgi:hypothetical protein